MKIYLISDNRDTAVGLRLAGVEGCVVADADEADAALRRAADDPDVGLILVTGKLSSACAAVISDIRSSHALPVITEIPDRHGNYDADSMSRYIGRAMGVRN